MGGGSQEFMTPEEDAWDTLGTMSVNIRCGRPWETRSRVRLGICDLRGRLVRTLVNERKEPGDYFVLWDGRDGAGRPVPSGVYLYRMEGGDGFVSTRRMVVLK